MKRTPVLPLNSVEILKAAMIKGVILKWIMKEVELFDSDFLNLYLASNM